MINSEKKEILGVGVNATDYNSAVQLIIRSAQLNKKLSVTALAVHGLMTGASDEIHKYRLNKLDLVLPDGQPVRWALNYLHKTALSDRVYGPLLMLKVCEAAAEADLPIYLYGSNESVVQKLADELRKKFPALIIAGKEPSKFRQLNSDETKKMVERITASGARIVFVGLGCPRQEVFVYENCDNLGVPVIAVGAAFDFHAGNLQQAPKWMQDRGLEWFFRLTREPRRLWRRYLTTNTSFCVQIALQLLGLRSSSRLKIKKPSEPLRYG